MGSESFNAVSSPLLTEKTIATKRQKLIGTLKSPPLPTLPFDLIPEILCRLPVKHLVQFRCVCKSWNSLISHPKFVKKHHRLSATHLVHILAYPDLLYDNYAIKSYPLDSVFIDVTSNHIAQLEFPSNHGVHFVGSCNGILCIIACDFVADSVNVRLWNPSIRKFKELPRLQMPQNHYMEMYGFGHDPITDNYKVVVVFNVCDINANFVDNQKVNVHTLGTNSWKSIQKFPLGYAAAHQGLGKFMHGTINWLVYAGYQHFIVSFDLGTESCKEILLPGDYGVINSYIGLHLGVLKDCLCMTFGHDVWVMKEYGNKDSWTKLFTISFMQDLPASHATIKVIHIFENGQVLLESIEGSRKLIIYNSRNGTFKFAQNGKFTKFENICEVCVESLISPCS